MRPDRLTTAITLALLTLGFAVYQETEPGPRVAEEGTHTVSKPFKDSATVFVAPTTLHLGHSCTLQAKTAKFSADIPGCFRSIFTHLCKLLSLIL